MAAGAGAVPANSSGSWVLLAFVMAWWSRGLVVSVVCGVLTLWSLLGGYVVAAELRGYPVAISLVVFWGVAGLLAGVLIGKSVYGLAVIAGTTSPVCWWLQAGVGVLLVVTNGLSRPDPRTLAAAIVVSAVVADAFSLLCSAA